MAEKTLTRKDLRKETGAPGWLISYLYDSGKLPIFRESPGKGYPRLYDVSSVDIVRKHLAKQSR